MSRHPSTTERGARGESRAAQFLRDRGYRIVETNFRCKMGEIDIVARHGSTLVFVEVRTRSSARFGRASETVNAAKQRQIARVARFYLMSRRPRFDTCRFDVVDITAGDLAVIEDAFRIDGH